MECGQKCARDVEIKNVGKQWNIVISCLKSMERTIDQFGIS